MKKRHHIVVRPIDTTHMEAEIQNFLDIYANAWKDNWGFVRALARRIGPLSRAS